MDLSDRLKWCRAAANALSARDLSELAGASHSVVSQLEQRLFTRPRAALLLGLARVLGCSAEWLLDGTGEAPSEEQVLAAVQIAQAEKKARDDAAAGADAARARAATPPDEPVPGAA